MWQYWPKDLVEDEPYIGDFFWQIDRIANEPEARKIFVRFWNRSASGRDPTERTFQHELAEYLGIVKQPP